MRRNRLLVVVVFLITILAACSSPPQPTFAIPTSTPLFTIPTSSGLPTPAATPSLPTQAPTTLPTQSRPTSMPATQVAPTSPVTGSTGERISMSTGSTVAYVPGDLAAGKSITYLAGALAGQYMMLDLTSATNNAYISLVSPDGSILLPASEKKSHWQGALPSNGDYEITVYTPSATRYTVQLTIPVRVKFAAGATTATVNGLVGARSATTYLLRAQQGQTMTVTINAPNNDIFLTIYGLEDGTPYVKSAMEQSSSSIKLPSTQDYVIEGVSTGDTSEEFTVTFVVK